MQLNPDLIYDKLVTLGTEWAEAQYTAELLEEAKKTLISQLSTQSKESSIAAKENYALRSDEYVEHIKAMVSARKAANKAKVKYGSAIIWAELKRTEAANERATMRSAV